MGNVMGGTRLWWEVHTHLRCMAVCVIVEWQGRETTAAEWWGLAAEPCTVTTGVCIIVLCIDKIYFVSGPLLPHSGDHLNLDEIPMICKNHRFWCREQFATVPDCKVSNKWGCILQCFNIIFRGQSLFPKIPQDIQQFSPTSGVKWLATAWHGKTLIWCSKNDKGSLDFKGWSTDRRDCSSEHEAVSSVWVKLRNCKWQKTLVVS